MPEYTALLLGSIVGNYWVGSKIKVALGESDSTTRAPGRYWLVIGITVNLMLLAYFKYANFFIDNLNTALGIKWEMGRIVLPIGISFFTFTQIAYLVDTWRRKVREDNFVHYGLFVTYFPHLIAGPVLHHAQMMPQFNQSTTYRIDSANLTAGLCIFAIGLFKKVVLADGVSPYADAVFEAADGGRTPDFVEAWLGSIAYTVQLYFDFSGYSDMAIGLSWMFNVRLPFNFNSPYKAVNISDFWRRWHMSLSQFLRDYLYVAMGGNRRGAVRRYSNLLITMVLGGLWHGASWSFVVWGTLHGLYLGVNHAFRALWSPRWLQRLDASRLFTLVSWLITILAVVAGWVVFRATTLGGAFRILESMATPVLGSAEHTLLWNAGLDSYDGGLWCFGLLLIACLAPNSNLLGERLLTFCRSSNTWSAIANGAAITMTAFLVVLNTMRDSVSAFIYFNF